MADFNENYETVVQPVCSYVPNISDVQGDSQHLEQIKIVGIKRLNHSFRIGGSSILRRPLGDL